MPSFPHEHSFCANGSRCHMTFEKTSMVLLRLKSRNLLLGGFIMPQFHLKSHGTDDTMRSSEPPTSSIHITMYGKMYIFKTHTWFWTPDNATVFSQSGKITNLSAVDTNHPNVDQPQWISNLKVYSCLNVATKYFLTIKLDWNPDLDWLGCGPSYLLTTQSISLCPGCPAMPNSTFERCSWVVKIACCQKQFSSSVQLCSIRDDASQSVFLRLARLWFGYERMWLMVIYQRCFKIAIAANLATDRVHAH